MCKTLGTEETLECGQKKQSSKAKELPAECFNSLQRVKTEAALRQKKKGSEHIKQRQN
jgi:hypothetical protein